MMRSVAVTGAGGFIGSAAVEALHAAGASVRALLGPQGAQFHVPPRGVRSTSCEITDVEALRIAFTGAEIVVHAAGPPSVFASLRDPIEFVRVHVLGTACVVEAMRAAGVSSIVYLSSAEVYGEAVDSIVDESHPLEPRSPYGAAKVGAEALLHAAAASFGLRGYLLRPFSVYGPRMTRASVLGSIIEQARHGNVVALADLASVRDYCHVRDVSAAIVSTCGGTPSGMAAMNVATGVPTSVRELVDLLGDALHRTFDVRINDEERRPQESKVARLVGDNARICKTLGWTPHYDIRSGLAETAIALGVR
jgi:nucleoside-diphosphate-sugar epimerase